MADEEWERQIKKQHRALEAALGAYNAVWQSWPGINADNVEDCRRVAMSAALGAAERS
jgi:hypothetical protein